MKKNSTLLLLLASWLFIYWPALSSMVSTWNNSNTYSHGYLMPMIVIYLIWERRLEWKSLPLQPVKWMVIFLIPIQTVQFLGDLSGIILLEQLAAYASLVVIVMAILGWPIIKIISFPLLYLIFSIPMGEELVPSLQQVTADISVWLLEVSGVPVFRDGLYIYLSNGTFEVAEACAGIRFLIASIALGTLFSYLFFQTMWKRLAFIALAMTFPIFANGIRAYGIMMIGHYSDMKYAVGADHLIYGWFFFSFVLVLLYLMGNAVKEPFKLQKAPSNITEPLITIKHDNLFAITLLAILVLWLPSLYQNSVMSSVNISSKYQNVNLFEEYSVEQLSNWHSDFKNADDISLYQLPLTDNKISVEFYVATYYEDKPNKELVNWGNWLYNKDHWSIDQSEHCKEIISNKTINCMHLTLVAIGEQKRELIFWYEVNNVYSANIRTIKLAQLIDKLKGNSGAGRFLSFSFESKTMSSTQVNNTIKQFFTTYGLGLVSNGNE